MPRFAYVNGRYVPHGDAAVHIEDRGFQFADGVYEVVSIHRGRLVDEAGHLDRLERSLNELRLQAPMTRRALALVMRELIRRNRLHNGLIYLQITRGVAPRDFKFPKGVAPTLVMTTKRNARAPAATLRDDEGVSVVSIPDIRWKRRDIKTVALLPQALGKQQAADAGAFEAWQVDDDGNVTEGCSSNAWIVTKDGVLVTRPATNDILNGITRRSVLAIAAREGYEFQERPFSVAEAQEAREAFLTSATTYVTPITRIDGQPVANGHPGSLSSALRGHYVAFAESDRAELYIAG
ncbi:D-amino-acid transaminase [Fodinicurvata sp. EGI_FJ10296]|uniref:D-amino-acid transaminase n=1 Tax=Fodinicurvata sp. EGI_FJ10296 TaxID=3231908 RepID=UPI003455E1E9